jgi:hypothetical protein
MRRSLLWLVLAGALLVAGCATQAQRQYQAITTGNKAIGDQMKACSAAVYNDAAAAPIRSHIPLDIREATLSELSDASFASPAEIDAINALYPTLKSCQRQGLDALLNTTPGFVPILTKAYSEGDDQTILLIQRKLTWGDYTKGRRDRFLALQVALQAEGQRVVSGLQQEHNAEMAQRQRAAEALSAWAQTQQLINATNRPVITNCNAFGNMVNCVSR